MFTKISKITLIVALLCNITYAQKIYTEVSSFQKNVYTPFLKAANAIEKGTIEYTETIYLNNSKIIVNYCKAGVLAFPHINTPTPVLCLSVNNDSLVYIIKLHKYIVNTNKQKQDIKEMNNFYHEFPFLAFYTHFIEGNILFPSEEYTLQKNKDNTIIEYNITTQNNAGHYKYIFTPKQGLLTYFSFQPLTSHNQDENYIKKEYQLTRFDPTFPYELLEILLNN